MARHKKYVLDIYQVLAECGACSVEKGVDILKAYEPAPDPAKLVEQYWRTRVRRLMRAKRDNSGLRDVYSDEKGTYYNVPTSKDRIALHDIDGQITTKVKKLIKVRRKIRARRKIVEGQLVLDLDMDMPNTQIGE